MGTTVRHVEPRPTTTDPSTNGAILEADEVSLGVVREGKFEASPIPRRVDRQPVDLFEVTQGPSHPGGMASPEDRTLIGAATTRTGMVAHWTAIRAKVLSPSLKGEPGGASKIEALEMSPPPRKGVDIKRVAGDLVVGTPIPGLGLNKPALESVGAI